MWFDLETRPGPDEEVDADGTEKDAHEEETYEASAGGILAHFGFGEGEIKGGGCDQRQ